MPTTLVQLVTLGIFNILPAGQQPSTSPRCEDQYAQHSLPLPGSRRHYRVPNPVPKPSNPYSKRVGRDAPQPWPEFERVVSLAKLAELAAQEPASSASKSEPLDLGLKLNRAVLRFPADVTVSLQGESVLALSGKAGALQIDLTQLDPTGLCAFQLMQLPISGPAPSQAGSLRPLLAVVSPHKERFDALCARVQSAVRGVSQGFLVGLNVKGVGYRVEPLDDHDVLARAPKDKPPGPGGSPAKPYFFEKLGADKASVAYPHPKPTAGLRLKVGYSRTALYALPPGVRAFIVKPTQFYLYGLDEAEVARVAGEIRSIRKPNAYTGNGIQLADEVIKLKTKAGAK